MSYTIFWDACRVGNIFEVKKVIKKIDDINKHNNEGWNAIIISAYNHHIEIIKYLLENGANINSINKNGTTVFMYAKTKVIQNNNYEILDFLLENGADINKKDVKNCWTVLDYVKQTGEVQLIEYLKNKGAV